MYLSYNWLKELVNMPKDITPEGLALKLTMHTVEVDDVFAQSKKFDNIAAGKVLGIKRHPNADKLKLVRVDAGDKTLDIVCGADNYEIGQSVPVALPGAHLANGMEIREVAVRGEKSEGMLCSEYELGIGIDNSGILILEGKPKPGTPLSKLFKGGDWIFEIDNKSITHRSDLWCQLGLAREISAFLDYDLTAKAMAILKAGAKIKPDKKLFRIKVEIEDTAQCPRYLAAAISGVEIKDSPRQIRDRLISLGMRPINNIVDITNYVMLEVGQPLHAFDLDKIAGEPGKQEARITARKAKAGESIVTLDGSKRKLNPSDLVIAGDRGPIAIAGLMGGADSEIGADTANILIESANFNFISIRKTSQAHGIRSEASNRYEKSLDPELCQRGLARAIELIRENCPGSFVAGEIADAGIQKPQPIIIKASFAYLSRMIGMAISAKQIEKTLFRLGFVFEKNETEYGITVPSWRSTGDVSGKEDIVEEISRIYGYDNIPKQMPLVAMERPAVNREIQLKRKIKDILALGCSLAEVYNYSFVDENQLVKMSIDPGEHIRLLNPISSQLALLRQNLTPNLLLNAVKNQARYSRIRIFEIGSTYHRSPGAYAIDNTQQEYLPYQEERIGILLAGDEGGLKLSAELKGIIEYLGARLKVGISFGQPELPPPWADASVNGRVLAGQKEIGKYSLLDARIAKCLGLKKKAVSAELHLNEMSALAEQAVLSMHEFDKYPPVIRDLAFVVDKKILYADIISEIRNYSKLIRQAELFDAYEGPKLGPKNKSLAFHIVYQADKTLTSEEAELLQQGLVKKLGEKFGAKLRDF